MEFTLAQLRGGEPIDFGASSWIDIDQTRINEFADATDDHQWIHVDIERAQQSQFGGTIAHGFLLVSMVPRLFTELFSVPEAKMLINYGLDKIRFINPVPAGSAIRLECRMTSVTERGGNLLMRVRGDLVMRGDDGEAGRRCVMLETLFLVVPPDGEDA